MGQRVATTRGKDLYAFWGSIIAEDINEAFEKSESEPKILLNVASQEYFKSIEISALNEGIQVVDCVFKDDDQIKSVYAKRARGLMVHHVVTKRVSTLDGVKAFDAEGYVFRDKESTDTTLVFSRTKQRLKRQNSNGSIVALSKKHKQMNRHVN
jgi:cytoplasmic iron level regulating protein YaaA (DUF328/UPF0246 family)